MKKNVFKLMMATLMLTFGACHEPDELLPPVSREGLNSITASFEDGTGEFVGEYNAETNEVIIPIPYFFPEGSSNRVTEEQLSNMRVWANLDDNVTIEPALLYMDLTKENIIVLTNQRNQKVEVVVKGEIRKSDKAFIEEFNLPELGLTGVINENTNTISLVSVEEIEPVLAEIELAPHATISPDPRIEAFDYSEGIEFTVTAHDGVTTQVYTVKQEVPEKLAYGIRPGSGKLMFAKQLRGDLGINVDHLTGGIAATQDYLAINTRGENLIYIDPKTGEKIGEIDLGSAKGSLVNFYTTADDAGNIVVNNLAPNAGSFKVWKISGVDAAPEPFIEWDGGVAVGRKLSIQGSLDGDAIITAPTHAAGQQFARWTVVGGVLTSQTPEVITMSGLEKGWTTNADIVYSSGSNTNSDYFVASYSDNTFAWVNGQTNDVRAKLDPISANYIPNAVDYIEFNNASYATVNWVNSFTWGAADAVWLLDVGSTGSFAGNLVDGTVPAVVWSAPLNTYGPNAIDGVANNANGTGDVALTVSEDGYYLYLFFMFTNGYVVGYQFDAIDM